MTKKDRKMAVLMALRKHNRPTTLNELLQILEPEFVERTHLYLNEHLRLIITNG